MGSLLNKNRPPAFCPGCSHDNFVHSLDRAFQNMGLEGHQIVLVSDIGCSGLVDTFFNTHALHGLHGRALTYAAGIKLSRPDLQVMVTMGDGGLGIGAAHLLAACRRNLDLTLFLLNNFNFGMTGGQFSSTTPAGAKIGSGFLNNLERPMDAGIVAGAAGAPYVVRVSAYQKDLSKIFEWAIRYNGFSLVDIWGVCPGRYLQRNHLSPRLIEDAIRKLEPLDGLIQENERPEYGEQYRKVASEIKLGRQKIGIKRRFEPPQLHRHEVIILGAAGQGVQTAGRILCNAGLSAGLKVTQKNDYGITVKTGPSVCEIILSPQEIDFTGIIEPTVVMAVANEGVKRRKDIFHRLGPGSLVIRAKDVEIPSSEARVIDVDFKSLGIKKTNWAIGALTVLAGMNQVISREMFDAATSMETKSQIAEALQTVKDKVLK